MKIYVASKVKHAPMWRELRSLGWPINSTWIDESGEGESSSLSDLASRCINEAAEADVLLLYCEPGEVQKGAMVEVGAALASGTPVASVGRCETTSKTFVEHPWWFEMFSVGDALMWAWNWRGLPVSERPPTTPAHHEPPPATAPTQHRRSHTAPPQENGAW